ANATAASGRHPRAGGRARDPVDRHGPPSVLPGGRMDKGGGLGRPGRRPAAPGRRRPRPPWPPMSANGGKVAETFGKRGPAAVLLEPGAGRGFEPANAGDVQVRAAVRSVSEPALEARGDGKGDL